jgi:hypothetical protein
MYNGLTSVLWTMGAHQWRDDERSAKKVVMSGVDDMGIVTLEVKRAASLSFACV